MNGAHDLGGMHGFGSIERDDATFHAEWEKRTRALVHAVRATGTYNIDESRYGIERMPPADYLAASYFERWLASLETNLVDKGKLTREEIAERVARYQADPSLPVPERLDAELAARVASARPRAMPDPDGPQPRFSPGDVVTTRNQHPRGHTRLPRYARGRRGVIYRIHGAHPLADARAAGRGACLEPLYSVRFEARDLWGGSADGPGAVYLDLWESYLESAKEA